MGVVEPLLDEAVGAGLDDGRKGDAGGSRLDAHGRGRARFVQLDGARDDLLKVEPVDVGQKQRAGDHADFAQRLLQGPGDRFQRLLPLSLGFGAARRFDLQHGKADELCRSVVKIGADAAGQLLVEICQS
ncbi:hypothetical protein D9M72_519120 [compost metagenome]